MAVCRSESRNKMKDEVKVFDALKVRKVLERVNKFLGVLIRENLVKDAPFLNDVEIENESDLADDVWEVLQGVPLNCDVGTVEEQSERFDAHCRKHMGCLTCPLREKDGCVPKHCEFAWAQLPYEERGTNGK